MGHKHYVLPKREHKIIPGCMVHFIYILHYDKQLTNNNFFHFLFFNRLEEKISNVESENKVLRQQAISKSIMHVSYINQKVSFNK